MVLLNSSCCCYVIDFASQLYGSGNVEDTFLFSLEEFRFARISLSTGAIQYPEAFFALKRFSLREQTMLVYHGLSSETPKTLICTGILGFSVVTVGISEEKTWNMHKVAAPLVLFMAECFS